MKLCMICPPLHIESTELLEGRFCIGTVALNWPSYSSYFENQVLAGMQVILDNGEFEGDAIKDEEFWTLAATMGRYASKENPLVIVAPDGINSSAKTNWERSADFIKAKPEPEEGKSIPEFNHELMFVPHTDDGPGKVSADTREMWDQIELVVSGCSPYRWLGFNRDTVHQLYGGQTHTDDQMMNNFVLAQDLVQNGWVDQCFENGIKIHFLGIGDRVHMLEHLWFAESCDTASFFWQTCCGSRMTEDGVLSTIVKRPRDYFKRERLMIVNPETLDNHIALESRLTENCMRAQQWADRANKKRRLIRGGQL